MSYTIEVSKNGTKKWFVDGQLHREDGPAVEWSDGSKEWYFDGKRHRTDGPAFEDVDGTKYWCINGVSMCEGEFNQKLRPLAGTEIVIDGIKYTLN